MSRFIESMESRQMASATPLNFNTETHTVTDDAVIDYEYHARGFENPSGKSVLGFISIQNIESADGSTARELMIGTVVTKKDGTTTLQFFGIVNQTGTPDAQNYVYKTTLSRDGNGNVLKDSTNVLKDNTKVKNFGK